MQVLILTLLVPFISALNKCCPPDTYLKTNNSVYFCEKDDDKRLQVFTKTSTGEGICVEAFKKNITEYRIRNHTVLEEKQIAVNFYPKCCPLGYFYNSVSHSCVWRKNMNESFIKQNFIRVGLPQCMVIVDYKLAQGNFSMELGNLYIGDLEKFKDGEFCMDLDQDGVLIARGCYEDLAVCEKYKCLRKCCPDGQSFVNGNKCKNTYEYGLDLGFTDRINNSRESFAIIHKKYTCRMYILRESRIHFYIASNGTFYAFSNKTNSYESYGIDKKSYCIEHVQKQKQNLNDFKFFMCFNDDPPKLKFLAERWAKILSCIFLVLIIAIYLFFPEMLNLFGLILLTYCITILATFIIFVYVQFETDLSDSACSSLSFASTFLVWSSFTWLNVMCFNIWWTFGSPKSFLTAKEKKRELKRFLLYNIYAWSVPASLTLIVYLVSNFTTPYFIRPILGNYKCYWERRPGNYGMLIFYVIPLVFMELINLVLYIRTLLYCLKVKGEINKLNDNRMLSHERRKNYNIDKEQLFLILKLSIIMGFFFAFEVITSIFDCSKYVFTEYIEIILDIINCLQGVFIFLIFGCKKKVFRFYRNRIFSSTIRKSSSSSTPVATTQLSEPLNSKSRSRNM